ncbi:hypothetical protein BBD39_11110 [Arsenophonus endosymbiont of Bemisia tabaci Asia II 3]|nr:hypothetical protein BBD39_11110 [Arsenophonus endosymbiont of Bemisia tabaci Asia II 3]
MTIKSQLSEEKGWRKKRKFKIEKFPTAVKSYMIGLAALLIRADKLEVNKFEPKLKYSHMKNIQVIV